MNQLANFRKKIIYGALIVILFVVMYPYSYWLTEEKKSRDLGEAAIGQIDTGSFMMKLFLLGGFRGIVADLLWINAEENKRDHDWDRLASTVDLITKLQPHFLSIWTFQGWNLAYNVSVEWDAPEDKYAWIKKGIQFVQDGVRKNKRSPDLIWDTAWFYYHKLGMSDESIILRRLFRDDEDEEFKTFKDPVTLEPVVGNDNFKLAYGWFSRAVELVDQGSERVVSGTSSDIAFGTTSVNNESTEIRYVDPTPQRKGRPDDIAFRSMPAHGQTRYAASLEKMSVNGIPATFGQRAQAEWGLGLREWEKLGKHVFVSHNEVPRNGRLERDLIKLDDSTNTEVYEKLNDNQKYWTARWADQMNYRYWKERCQAEQTEEGVTARQLFYEGTIAYKTADFPKAAEKFKQGLTIWKKVLNEFPVYRDDDLNRKDTGLIVKRYAAVLKQAGEPMPENLPFKDLLPMAMADTTVDPFDAIEMIGVVGNALPQATPTQAAPTSKP